MPKKTPSALEIIKDTRRLAALRQYNILDTPAEPEFDDITQLAADIYKTPLAFITFIDSDRQFFKSSVGSQLSEAPLEGGLCPFVATLHERLIVPDASADPRFAAHSAVAELGIRFYAGVPLVTAEGQAIGTLCVMDTVLRELQPSQLDSLTALARQVISQLSLRLSARQMAQTNSALTLVSRGVAAEVGDTFFASLVQHFTQALGVDYAYISLLKGDESDQLETIAVCHQGKIVDNFEYERENTPCAEILQTRSLRWFDHALAERFPKVPMIASLHIESYAATPIYNSYGAPLGVLAIMDTKPLTAPDLVEPLLTIFGIRIAAELERQHNETKQQALLERTESALRQAEDSNRLKDEFLAVVSHELRSPLNPIVGWSQLLQRGVSIPKKEKKAIAIIERNAKLQLQLVENLLDISRIQRGQMSLQAVPVLLAPVIAAALRNFELAAEAKPIRLEFVLADDAIAVMGDADRLQQVMWNLLSNAIKFTPKNGRVTVTLSATATHAQIQVSDTGKGICPSFLPHLFDHFRQQDYSTTRKFGGLGIGTAIVRHLVEMHGGTISAHSPGEDQGTTFTLNLPLASQQPTENSSELCTGQKLSQ
ncbi:MAG: ATP-binding protein [Phormidesmis sp.]